MSCVSLSPLAIQGLHIQLQISLLIMLFLGATLHIGPKIECNCHQLTFLIGSIIFVMSVLFPFLLGIDKSIASLGSCVCRTFYYVPLWWLNLVWGVSGLAEQRWVWVGYSQFCHSQTSPSSHLISLGVTLPAGMLASLSRVLMNTMVNCCREYLGVE